MCEWWLSHIHISVKKFLENEGFISNALPSNYTDKPPEDLEMVYHNHKILRDILDGKCKEKCDVFTQRTVDEVYKVLDPFFLEMEYVLSAEWCEYFPDIAMSDVGKKNLESDFQYLIEMKQMDEKIREERRQGIRQEKERVEMTSTVPIAGLVYAQFHVIECELSTSIDIWAQQKGAVEGEWVSFFVVFDHIHILCSFIYF